jgi:hypothetical protein
MCVCELYLTPIGIAIVPATVLLHEKLFFTMTMKQLPRYFGFFAFLPLVLLGLTASAFVTPRHASTARITTTSISTPLFSSSPSDNNKKTKKKKSTKSNRFFNATDVTEQPLVKTIGGGTELMFEMARRMLFFDDQKQRVLPRWHPHSGISDNNPSFRTQSPIMNNQGYAQTIWRNVRKRNKPSLWRHALRTYSRMNTTTAPSVLNIQPSTAHHAGALLACAKLGLWERALEILDSVEGEITDAMILSLVQACVRASRSSSVTTLQDRQAPLDAAVSILTKLQEDDELEFPIMAIHWNPLAAAYQSLGLYQKAQQILLQLPERQGPPEPEERDQHGLNTLDLEAKDKATYALLVQGAVAEQDWQSAIIALTNMTEAGLYPSARHLNRWQEESGQRSRKSWKRKRQEYWLESVQYEG